MKKLSRIPLLLLFVSCSVFGTRDQLPDGVEALSLNGDELSSPLLPIERHAKLSADLRAAEQAHARNPTDEMAAIWHGRRLAYLGRYREAIDVFSAALVQHPASYRLLRHRGHRYITTRRFELAIQDLQLAAEYAKGIPDAYEEDGAPNEFGVPRSTTHSNIYYHLALALYLERDFTESLAAWKRCLYFSRVNDDMFVAATYWTALTLWRLGDTKEAQAHLAKIRDEMDILENRDYHRLLMLFRGRITENEVLDGLEGSELSSATVGYGLGAWHRAQGRRTEAQAYFKRVVAETFWPAFGYIAAEAELERP